MNTTELPLITAVPLTTLLTVVTVSGLASSSRAMPKSVTLAWPSRVDQDVLRLDVAVDEPAACAASSPRPISIA